MEESREELQARILGYQEQLSAVDKLLITDPSNAQFLNLREDLQKVINLTSELLIIKEANNSSSLSSNVTGEGALNGENSDDASEDDDIDSEDEYLGNRVPQMEAPKGSIGVGETIEVLGGDRPYAGVITAIEESSTYRVKYFEYEAEVALPSSSIVKIAPGPLTAADISVGFRCQCKYAADQKFYNAVVTSVTARGFIVKYVEYGNTEEVPVEYLHPLTQNKKAQHDGKALITIPENLKIKPTDTEEEKARKRKKIKAIKARNRDISKELEVAAVQQSWQKFVAKGGKRASVGANILKKTSMFASPEAIEGKVGVVNSGKGLTEFAQRKKHKFSI